MEAVKKVIACPHITLKEVHCHIGSQIFDIDPFVHAAEVMLGFIRDIREQTGVTIECLNLGGGFGIQYTKEDTPKSYDSYMEKVSQMVKAKAEEYQLPIPYIYLEPGRSIVGEAGITLYRVGGIKEIPNIRTYVSID